MDEWKMHQRRLEFEGNPDVQAEIQRAENAHGRIGHGSAANAMWTTFIHGHDQLRQRIALALSEIFVVSSRNTGLQVRPYAVASYWDELAKFAGGSAEPEREHNNTYRDLLEYISKSPVMGLYLSHLKNKGEHTVGEGDSATVVLPDENYAREIMQLFSIGLLELLEDGRVKISPEGLPTQTYGNDDIENLARVFTGWSFSKYTNNGLRIYDVPDESDSALQTGFYTGYGNGKLIRSGQFHHPMKNFAEFHDDGLDDEGNPDPKQFLDSDPLPVGVTGQEDLTNALNVIAGDDDQIEGHKNVAPFMAKLLIKRFVTSNPSPGYVYRVANVFNGGTNYGSGSGLVDADGVKGDFLKVVTAILFDSEARDVDLSDPLVLKRYGKVKEPLLAMTQVYRAGEMRFDYQTPNGNYTVDVDDLGRLSTFVQGSVPEFPISNYPATQIDNLKSRYPNRLVGTLNMGTNSPAFGQGPVNAPSVFNFFYPDYTPSGDLQQAGLTSPELQIFTESSLVNKYNWVDGAIREFKTQYSLRATLLMNSDLSPHWSWLPGDTVEKANAFVDNVDLIFNAGEFRRRYGTAAGTPRDAIIQAVVKSEAHGGSDYTFARVPVLYLMLNSPIGQMQR